MKKYIVTGGEGFIGSKITDVVQGESFDIKSGLTILDTAALETASTGVAGIFHCAAKISVPESVEKPDEYHHTNVIGTESVVRVALKVAAKIVFSSSSAVYGESDTFVTEDHPLNPKSPYAENKKDGENLIRDSKVPSVILRYFNVYGPGQSDAYAGVITIFIKKALAGEDLIIYGDGTQTRDFVFVDDVARANVIATNREFDTCEVFNIASGESVSIRDLAELIIRLSNSSSKISYKETRSGDILHSRADIAKARRLLEWEPKISLEEGLRITINSMR